MKLTRRTLIGGLIGGLAGATTIAATRAEDGVVTIPGGECEIACWDEAGTPVPCLDPCPDEGEATQTPESEDSSEAEYPVGVAEKDEWLYEVDTLPSTGTGSLVIDGIPFEGQSGSWWYFADGEWWTTPSWFDPHVLRHRSLVDWRRDIGRRYTE